MPTIIFWNILFFYGIIRHTKESQNFFGLDIFYGIGDRHKLATTFYRVFMKEFVEIIVRTVKMRTTICCVQSPYKEISQFSFLNRLP